MTNTDKTLSTERLEQIAASDTAHMGEAQRMASELLASRTQSPAEWQVEAAMNATPHEGSNVTVGEILAKAGAGTTTMRAALRAASVAPPAPERSKEEVVPRLPNCGKYLAQDNAGNWHYLNHAGTWQGFQGPQEAERCFICNEPIKAGELVLSDVTEGLGHRACFGEDREGYVNLQTGEPIGADEPIPTGWPYEPDSSHHPVTISPEEGVRVTDAARDVLAERRRQVEAEGWTPEHDDAHDDGQMARAAACYAISASSEPDDHIPAVIVDTTWPWSPEWWKPTHARRDLVKAGALIIAEIERLDRAALSVKPGEQG